MLIGVKAKNMCTITIAYERLLYLYRWLQPIFPSFSTICTIYLIQPYYKVNINLLDNVTNRGTCF